MIEDVDGYRNFRRLLEAKWEQGKFVCVGLDSDTSKLPKTLVTTSRSRGHDPQFAFNRFIVDATKDLVCAYKPNSAFYESEGAQGLTALEDTIAYIHEVAPDVPVILDFKRGDIGNTNNGYVRFAFDICQADAVTVHPYLGVEAMKPFLDCVDKGVIVLCRTSNDGAGEFQDLFVAGQSSSPRLESKLYRKVAKRVADAWNYSGNCALVVGATYPEELSEVRAIAPDLPILIPGIGAQGGDLEATIKAGADSRGRGMIINNSRGIIFASSDDDFAAVARVKTIEMPEQITAALAAIPKEA